MDARLTHKQSRVLEWISEFVRVEHVPPTLGDIADAFGWRSKTAAMNHVNALIRKGHLERVRA